MLFLYWSYPDRHMHTHIYSSTGGGGGGIRLEEEKCDEEDSGRMMSFVLTFLFASALIFAAS